MARFEDSPDLFGRGMGVATAHRIKCGWCGNDYNFYHEEDDELIDDDLDTTPYTEFADKKICSCCWEKIEDEIFSRMPDVLKWYSRILRDHRAAATRDIGIIKDIVEILELDPRKRVM